MSHRHWHRLPRCDAGYQPGMALGAGPCQCSSGCRAAWVRLRVLGRLGALVLPGVLSCSPVGGLPPRCGAASEYCQCNVKEMAPSCAEMTCVASSTYQSDTIN